MIMYVSLHLVVERSKGAWTEGRGRERRGADGEQMGNWKRAEGEEAETDGGTEGTDGTAGRQLPQGRPRVVPGLSQDCPRVVPGLSQGCPPFRRGKKVNYKTTEQMRHGHIYIYCNTIIYFSTKTNACTPPARPFSCPTYLSRTASWQA